MTEREVVGVALAMAAAAILALDVPLTLVGLAVIAAIAFRHPVAVGVAAVLVTSVLAARGEAGLADGARGAVSTRVVLVTDPVRSPWGSTAQVAVGGHRYLASFPADTPAATDALAGETLAVRGVVGDLRLPFTYRAANHLAGRLSVSEAADRRVAWWPIDAANRLRRLMASGVSSFGAEDAALFTGVVYGDDRAQSEVAAYRFRRSGLAHLLAVSGQNVGFVLLMASPVLMRIELRARLAVTFTVVGLFVAVTRAEPSVLRASAMALVVAWVAWRGRYATAVRILGVSVSALIAIDPLMVWSVGFQLSVGASAALIAVAAPLADRASRPRAWHLPLAASVAAQAGTAPVLAAMAGSVPLVGPLANLVAVPVAGALMVYGLCAAPLAGLMGAPLAVWVGWPSRVLLWVLETVAAAGSASWWPSVGVAGAVAWTVATLAAIAPSGRARRVTVIAAVAVVLLDAAFGAPRGAVGDGRSVRAWVAGGRAVMVLDGSSTERAALATLVRGRVRRVTVIVVIGGGARSSGVVASMRRVVPVDEVVARRPETVRDARRLDPMVIPIGPTCVVVTLAGERAEVEAVDRPEGGCEEAAPAAIGGR